ncbi:hypothetical protein OHC33_000153 [Knufia fluminis]|uniref:Uncharacterized protein n=1 Tax=Knufia fluminis TaxID=191047 RepID=A0AAN8ICD7_9EURO|nr:hypothetical protein OHC33_000153 [Knufia fluminis]
MKVFTLAFFAVPLLAAVVVGKPVQAVAPTGAEPQLEAQQGDPPLDDPIPIPPIDDNCVPPGGICGRDENCCSKKCLGWPYYSCG